MSFPPLPYFLYFSLAILLITVFLVLPDLQSNLLSKTALSRYIKDLYMPDINSLNINFLLFIIAAFEGVLNFF